MTQCPKEEAILIRKLNIYSLESAVCVLYDYLNLFKETALGREMTACYRDFFLLKIIRVLLNCEIM